MKRTAVSIAVTLMLSGCAGLSVNFDMAITYRSDVPIGNRSDK